MEPGIPSIIVQLLIVAEGDLHTNYQTANTSLLLSFSYYKLNMKASHSRNASFFY